MATEFNVGDTVTWTSQAGGHTRIKVGSIEEVVPPGSLPNRAKFEPLFRSGGVGAPRNHVSYVVRVPGKTTKSAGTVYWPRAAALLKGTLGQIEATQTLEQFNASASSGAVAYQSGAPAVTTQEFTSQVTHTAGANPASSIDAGATLTVPGVCAKK